MKALRRTIVALAAVVAGTMLLAGAPAQAAPGRARTSGVEVSDATLRLAASPNLVADVANASRDDGAPTDLWALNGGANQLWTMESSLDGYYRFKSLNSGKCLNVQNASTADIAPVIQWPCGAAPNELWMPVRAGTGYQLVNKNSGKCLNVQNGVAQGNALIQYACSANGAANDVWLTVWAVPPTS